MAKKNEILYATYYAHFECPVTKKHTEAEITGGEYRSDTSFCGEAVTVTEIFCDECKNTHEVETF